MKTFANLFLLIILSLQSFCQSLTLKDLKYLLSAANKDKFLTNKLYKVQQKSSTGVLKLPITYYVRNNSSKSEPEMVITGLGSFNKNHIFLPQIGYMTKDSSYVNALIEQIHQADFQLIEKRIESEKLFFRFKNNELNILVTKRQNGRQSQIYLIKSF